MNNRSKLLPAIGKKAKVKINDKASHQLRDKLNAHIRLTEYNMVVDVGERQLFLMQVRNLDREFEVVGIPLQCIESIEWSEMKTVEGPFYAEEDNG